LNIYLGVSGQENTVHILYSEMAYMQVGRSICRVRLHCGDIFVSQHWYSCKGFLLFSSKQMLKVFIKFIFFRTVSSPYVFTPTV